MMLQCVILMVITSVLSGKKYDHFKIWWGLDLLVNQDYCAHFQCDHPWSNLCLFFNFIYGQINQPLNFQNYANYKTYLLTFQKPDEFTAIVAFLVINQSIGDIGIFNDGARETVQGSTVIILVSCYLSAGPVDRLILLSTMPLVYR